MPDQPEQNPFDGKETPEEIAKAADNVFIVASTSGTNGGGVSAITMPDDQPEIMTLMEATTLALNAIDALDDTDLLDGLTAEYVRERISTDTADYLAAHMTDDDLDTIRQMDNVSVIEVDGTSVPVFNGDDTDLGEDGVDIDIDDLGDEGR